ncbi:MAG: NADH-quinone oxidoreductase subunit C [Armatimonadetes bacterium]|nr:NADH-quinone oxidoreductase subunit C [Armatimonadota bacterium]
MAKAAADRTEASKIKSAFPKAFVSSKVERGELYVCVKREAIVDVLQFLKDDLGYEYFSECLGVDYSTWKHERDFTERFEVVYNLMTLNGYHRIFVKIGVDDGQKVPTAKHVYLGAEYPEKEIADLFGVIFEGNELRGERFLLPDDWSGFPLRKEYPLGGDDVIFDQNTRGPAVEDMSKPHAGESFEGKTGSGDVSGR